jgi:hypothetical protein
MQTYFLVGAGGTGTHLLPALLAYLRTYHGNTGTEYQVVIADGDIFEPKNLTRQIFAEGMVSINKAEAMLQMHPGHPIIAVSRYIGKADVETMIQDGDCVLICADNYSIRSLIVDHVKTLNSAVVINAGNEVFDGSVQLWVREGSENITPSLTYGHPEIAFTAENDRAAMDCLTIATLPGGEQTILANMTSATYMLLALQRWHADTFRTGWTELQFDLLRGQVDHINMRERRNWAL